MAVHSIKAVQKMPVSLDTAWHFFSAPSNLQYLTPAKLDFKVISLYHGEEMYPGQIIEYTVKPLLGIPLYWMTEITQVEDKKYFIDEQRYGPYSLWHHQHHFKAIDGGVEMTDIVHYKIPFWFIGEIANGLLVRKSLKEIFDFRFHYVEQRYGKWPSQQAGIVFD